MAHHPILRRIAWLRRNRCSLLLGALCVMILANPMFASTALGPRALSLTLLIILLLASWALRVRRPVLLVFTALAALTAGVILSVPDDNHWMRPIANGTMALFTGIVTVALL